MKSNLIAVLIAATFASISTVSFAGSDTTTVVNRLNVVANCEFLAQDKELNVNFDLDPSQQVDRFTSVGLRYKCTNHNQYTLTLNGGSTASSLLLDTDPTKQIPFSLTFAAGNPGTTANGLVVRGTGMGFSNVNSASLFNLRIPHVSFKDVPAGFYQKVINVTLTE